MSEDKPQWENPVFGWFGGRKSLNGYLGWLTALGSAYFMEATYVQVMTFSLIALGLSIAGNAISDFSKG